MEVSKYLDFTFFDIISRARRKIYPRSQSSGYTSNQSCVFVLSTGRVGTATLSRLLGLSENLIVHHEPQPKLYEMAPIAYKQSLQPIQSELVNEALDASFIALRGKQLNYALSIEKSYVETSPQVTFLAPSILRKIPDAKFIHLIRSPYDVVRSAMRRKWFQGNIYDSCRISPLQGTEMYTDWEQLSPIEKNIWLWSETNKWISDFLRKLPAQQKLTMLSEKLFDNEDLEINNLYRFVSSEKPSAKKIKKILSQKINRQTTGISPSFECLQKKEQQLLLKEWKNYFQS